MTHADKIAKLSQLSIEQYSKAQLVDPVMHPEAIQEHRELAALFAEAAEALAMKESVNAE